MMTNVEQRSAAKTKFTVSVVVPTFKRLDHLKRCLDGVERMTVPSCEIIVPHRPDADPDTAAWLKAEAPAHPLWRLVELDRPGVVNALNAALKHVHGDIIAIFDDDTVARPDWLEKILHHFEVPDVGAVGGRDVIHKPGGPELAPVNRNAGMREPWGGYYGSHHLVVGPAHDVVVLKGCDWAVRRSAIGTLRFDERLLGIGAQPANDYWFCKCLYLAGWRIVLDPDAVVDHYPGFNPDYRHSEWTRKKCYEVTSGGVALSTANMTTAEKAGYILFYIVWGRRNCPGLYFIAHSLAKRPRALPGMLIGGWSGFLDGLRRGSLFTKEPPGHANPPPKP